MLREIGFLIRKINGSVTLASVFTYTSSVPAIFTTLLVSLNIKYGFSTRSKPSSEVILFFSLVEESVLRGFYPIEVGTF